MNKTLTYILISGASALAGGIAGYIFCKKRMMDKFDQAVSEAINKELSSIREARAKELENNTSKSDVVDEPAESEADIYQMVYDQFEAEAVNAGIELNPYRVSMLTACLQGCREKGFDADKTYEAIQKMMAECESPEEEIEEEDDDPYDPMDDFNHEPPHVIPLSDYQNLPSIFEFLTFHYFEHDDVLIDDGDEIVDDIEGVVGDALNHFDEEEDDGDCVYVINGKMGLAIEINRLHASYAEWNGWGG